MGSIATEHSDLRGLYTRVGGRGADDDVHGGEREMRSAQDGPAAKAKLKDGLGVREPEAQGDITTVRRMCAAAKSAPDDVLAKRWA